MKRLSLVLLVVMLSFNSCTVKFNGASIPPNMKTISIPFFENNAQLVVPTLSQSFTEDLKTRIRTQTSLSLTQQGDADAVMEGRITGYDVSQVSTTDNRQLTQGTSRLTITVAVKYTNNLNPKQSFEESFTRFKNFVLNGANYQSLEPQLIKDINVMLTEDIFNRAFAQCIVELENNNKERLSVLLAEPHKTGQQDVSLLEDLTRRFPYFQPARLLLAKAAQGEDQASNAAAALYANGLLLHKVLRQKDYPQLQGFEIIEKKTVPSQPGVDVQEESQEVYEEISELDIDHFKPAFSAEDPSSKIETIEDDFVLEKPSTEKQDPVSVSNYHDDSLPYTFLWWLAKTRKEHQSVFQPYASPKKNNPGELQQQYVEHIFHIQSPFNAEEVINNTPGNKHPDHKETEIIDSFLKKDPQISPPKAEQIDNENKAKKSAEDQNDLVSETLAKIYIEQMLYHKAIDTYQKLSGGLATGGSGSNMFGVQRTGDVLEKGTWIFLTLIVVISLSITTIAKSGSTGSTDSKIQHLLDKTPTPSPINQAPAGQKPAPAPANQTKPAK
eukprot:gene13072-15952_t